MSDTPEATPEIVPALKNIAEAINWVQQQVGYVQKTKSGGLKYTFAGEAALIQALRPYMVEAGIVCNVIGVQVVERSSYKTSGGTEMNSTLALVTSRFTHAASGSFIDSTALGEGADVGDKSASKAQTGGYKYNLRQTFVIETGDDPDEHASEGQARSNGTKATITINAADAAKKAAEADAAKKSAMAAIVNGLSAYYASEAAVKSALIALKSEGKEFNASQVDLAQAALIEYAQREKQVVEA
jgi:hypothetical protein